MGTHPPTEIIAEIFRYLHPEDLVNLLREQDGFSAIASMVLHDYHVWTVVCESPRDLILSCDELLPTPLVTPITRKEVHIGEIRPLRVSIPVRPNGYMKYAFVGKFVRWAYKFTTLRELQVIAVLSHPHACYGGKRWKTHDNTTQDIMAMFERLKPISNQEVKIMFDVGLPKTRGDGLYIDMSSYEFDRWIQTYQKEFQESRNRRVRRTSKRLKKAPSYVRT